MDTKEIRRNKLRSLIESAGSIKSIAESAGTDANYLSALASNTPPKAPSGKPRGIGDALARRLEKSAGKPHGWMDTIQDFGTAESAWMVLFSKLTKEQQKEAIQFVEYLLSKETR